MALQGEDDKDVLVFHDILAEEPQLSQADSERPISTVPGSNNMVHQPQSSAPAPGPSEDSPLKSQGQIGPRKPSVECCGFGMGAVILVTSSLVLAFALTLGLILSIRFGPSQIPPSGSVSSPSQLCTDIGIKLIQDKKASSADAVIAMAFCTGVVRGESSGLGGDGFAIFHDHRRSIDLAWIGRSCSPQNVGELVSAGEGQSNPFAGYNMSGWAVAIPSELSLLTNLYVQRGGKVPWSDLIMPAVEIAKNGFKLTKESVETLKTINATIVKERMGEFASKYFDDQGNVKPAGTVIKREDLAAVLGNIKSIDPKNLKQYYSNNFGPKVVKAVGPLSPSGKPLMVKEDFSSNCVLNISQRNPLTSVFKDFNLIFPELPSTAMTVAEILGIFASGDWQKEHLIKDDATMHHHIAEATKYALVDLFQLKKTDRKTVNTYLNETYWTKIAKIHIGEKAVESSSTWAEYSMTNDTENIAPLPLAETTGNFVAAIDTEEKFTALTLSLGSPFGSMIRTEDGIVLNNHMEAFYYNRPDHPNAIGKSKMPWSLQTPIIAHVPRSCKIRAALAAMPFRRPTMPDNPGEPVASSWHVLPHLAEVIARLVGAGMESASSSIKRWRYSPLPLIGKPEWLIVEGNSSQATGFVGAPSYVVSGLKSKGQKISDEAGPLSIIGSVSKESDHLLDRTDPRSPNSTAKHFGPT